MVNVPLASLKSTQRVPGVDVMMQASIAKPYGSRSSSGISTNPEASPSLEIKDDTGDSDVGPDNVCDDQNSQPEEKAEPPWACSRRVQRRKRPAPDKSDGPAQKDMPRRK